MNTHTKHKDPFKLEVGDLFCWDRWYGGCRKTRIWLALVLKVNKKTVDLHFLGEDPLRNCELTGKTFFKDNSRKLRVDKSNLAHDISNRPTRAAWRRQVAGSAMDEELYFFGSKET